MSTPPQPPSPAVPAGAMKTCLGCGIQIPSVYTVCPYCRHDPRRKRKHGPAIPFAGTMDILAGVIWFAVGGFHLLLWTSHQQYPGPYYSPHSYWIAGILLHVGGISSLVAGILALKRERYLWIVALTIVAIGTGISMAVLLINPMVGELTIVNIISLVTLLVFKEEFEPG